MAQVHSLAPVGTLGSRSSRDQMLLFTPETRRAVQERMAVPTGTLAVANDSESSSFAPFLFAHFCSPLTLREPNYRNQITRQFNLTSDFFSPECTPCLV